MNWFWVFIGGGLGSMVRYAFALALARPAGQFPWATFVANGVSCVVLGVLTSFLVANPQQDSSWRLAGMIGFCGGFSTFSTFTAENFHLLQRGEVALAVTNVLLSVLVCLLCFYLGFKWGQ